MSKSREAYAVKQKTHFLERNTFKFFQWLNGRNANSYVSKKKSRTSKKRNATLSVAVQVGIEPTTK